MTAPTTPTQENNGEPRSVHGRIVMVQSPLMATSRQLTGIGILAACFFVIGCTTFTSSSINTVTDRQGVSGHRSSRPKLGNPFRRPSAIDREGLGLIGSATTFHWNTVATTASGEPLQVNSAGDGGFRSLVVGSVGGDDAIALKLTEDLAHYLHHNRLIIGGLNAIVLRTLNPDGMKLGRHENSDGVYINNLFPKSDLTLLPTQARPANGDAKLFEAHVTGSVEIEPRKDLARQVPDSRQADRSFPALREGPI